MAKKKEIQEESLEKQLWKSADKLRKNIDAAEYKHVVMGLIFLKYISDAFEELYATLKAGEGEYAGADPEDKDEYKAENVFFVPQDARWQYGTPPTGNANYAWIQHFIYHLAPSGQAGFVLAKGALTSKTSGEGEIRKALVEAGLIDCIVNLPAKLFLNTQIPASLWLLSRNRTSEILFIDARNMGNLINRRTRELSAEDLQTIAGTYHNWRNPDGDYEDVKGFCNAAPIEQVKELDYVLTPGRYVGLAEEVDDFDFSERFTSLKAEFESQLKEEAELNQRILENLAKVKIGD